MAVKDWRLIWCVYWIYSGGLSVADVCVCVCVTCASLPVYPTLFTVLPPEHTSSSPPYTSLLWSPSCRYNYFYCRLHLLVVTWELKYNNTKGSPVTPSSNPRTSDNPRAPTANPPPYDQRPPKLDTESYKPPLIPSPFRALTPTRDLPPKHNMSFLAIDSNTWQVSLFLLLLLFGNYSYVCFVLKGDFSGRYMVILRFDEFAPG